MFWVQLCLYMQMVGEEKRASHYPLDSVFDLVGLLRISMIKPRFKWAWQGASTLELGKYRFNVLRVPLSPVSLQLFFKFTSSFNSFSVLTASITYINTLFKINRQGILPFIYPGDSVVCKMHCSDEGWGEI